MPTKSSSQSQAFWVLVSLNVLMFLINIDYTAVNLALVSIAADVDVDLNTVQWVLSGYVLAWSALVIPCGKLADIYGKRRMLLYGVWVFVIASLLIGISENVYLIIAGRFLQGVGGALFVPPIYSLIFSAVPKEKQGLAIGTLGATAGLGLAAGPSFGGLILHYFGWKWIFFVNIPIGLLVIAIALMTIDKEPSKLLDETPDAKGAILLASSLIMLVFGLNQLEDWGLNTLIQWIVFGASFALLFLFIMQQKGKAEKMIPLSFFKSKSYLGCVIGIFCFEFIFSCYIVLMGLYLQNILDFDVKTAGYIFLAMTLSFGLFSPLGGKLVDMMDGRIPIVGGMLITAVGAGMAVYFAPGEDLMFILGSLFLSGLGLGVSIAPVNAIMMQSVDEKHVSTASGMFAMLCLFGATIGIIFSTSLMTYLARNSLFPTIEAEGIMLTDTQQDILYQIVSTARYSPTTFEDFSEKLSAKLIPMIDLAFTNAMGIVFIFCVILALVEAFVSFVLIKPKA